MTQILQEIVNTDTNLADYPKQKNYQKRAEE
jgi:hypothetical protein